MKLAILAAAIVAIALPAAAQSLYDQQTGKYLGNLGGSRYDSNSTSNPYGRYGSRYSPDSINNPYGQYGSRYSPNSPNNPYATNPPIIVDDNWSSPNPWGSDWND